VLRALSNLVLNVSRDGASTTSLGNPFQCFTTLTVKNFFLISSPNLPCFSLKPLPLVLSLLSLLKRLSYIPMHTGSCSPVLRRPGNITSRCKDMAEPPPGREGPPGSPARGRLPPELNNSVQDRALAGPLRFLPFFALP